MRPKLPSLRNYRLTQAPYERGASCNTLADAVRKYQSGDHSGIPIGPAADCMGRKRDLPASRFSLALGVWQCKSRTVRGLEQSNGLNRGKMTIHLKPAEAAITEDDAFIAEALKHANVPTLMMSIIAYHRRHEPARRQDQAPARRQRRL